MKVKNSRWIVRIHICARNLRVNDRRTRCFFLYIYFIFISIFLRIFRHFTVICIFGGKFFRRSFNWWRLMWFHLSCVYFYSTILSEYRLYNVVKGGSHALSGRFYWAVSWSLEIRCYDTEQTPSESEYAELVLTKTWYRFQPIKYFRVFLLQRSSSFIIRPWFLNNSQNYCQKADTDFSRSSIIALYHWKDRLHFSHGRDL